MAAHVSKNGQRSGGNDSATDGQAVQAVSQVHGVARTYNYDHDEQYKRRERQGPQVRVMTQTLDHQIRPELLHERDHQVSGILADRSQTYQNETDQRGR